MDFRAKIRSYNRLPFEALKCGCKRKLNKMVDLKRAVQNRFSKKFIEILDRKRADQNRFSN